MADVDLELEGDVDDLECGLETVFGRSEEKKLAKPQQSKVHQSSSKNKTVTSRAEQSEKPQTGTLSNSGNKSQLSVTPANKLPPRKQSDSTRKNVSKVTSNVGDIADLIGSLDSDRKKASEMLSKINTKTDDNKVESPKSVVPSVAATRKRKASASDNTDPVKAKKIDDVKDKCTEPMDDTDDVIITKEEKVGSKYGKIVPKDDKDDVVIVKEEKVGGKDGKIVPKEDKDVVVLKDEKTVQKIPPCSEEDCRIIDNELVEEMMEKVKKGALPFGDRYIVRFSPVEIGDLADESVQKLISSTANLVFYFKRQGKFKKKKGYAEVYLFQAPDAVVFIEKLLQLKLLECRIEVTVTMPKLNKDNDTLSFVICLDKNSKLVKLKSAEDGSKVSADTPKEHLQIEKVPASADTQTLRMLFPFAVDVAFSPESKKVESEFKGPVNVTYINAGLLEAVLDCCSEHTFNGQSLSVKYTKKKQEHKVKPDAEVKREATTDTERRSSVHDKNGDSGSKTDKDGTSSSAKTKVENSAASGSTTTSDIVDEDISNMTRDVCSGMMESLNKLRQLGTDNPNVMRILEMQNELLKLQQTLSTDQSPTAIEEDPWTVTAADNLDDKQNKPNESEKEQEKKLPKEQKKKPEKESRTEKQRREMEDLQRMIDEAEVAKRQREERAKRNLEIEMQKMKELEEKRKSGWARRMIEDAKQTHVSGENTTSKEEVQRILKLVENKRKEAEEAKNVEETKVSETIKSEQAAGNAGRPDEILKTMGLDSPEIPDLNQLTDKSAASGKPQNKTEDIKTDEIAWSPSRALHEGAPVYSEEEFSQVCSSHTGGVLPWDHHVRITYYTDRRCPVESCPATKYFKTAESFLGHWELFHTPQVTVKFCQKCNAYFTNVSELETHLLNRHSVNNPQTVKQMSLEAREKIVANPSFRDPGRYLPPLA